MRIAFATHAYAPAIGGAERYAQGLAEALGIMGHEVHVVTPASTSAEAFYEHGHAPVNELLESVNGVSVHRLPLAATTKWWKPAPSSGPIDPTIAHDMWRAYGTHLATELHEISPEALVVLPHAFPNVSKALSLPNHEWVVAYAPLLHEEDPAWSVASIAGHVARAGVTVALTEWERGRLIASYGSIPDSTIVVPPGVEAPAERMVTALERPDPYIVAVGRRSASKHLPEIADAVLALRAEGIALDFILVGPAGDEQVDSDLGARGDTAEIAGRVGEGAKWSILKGALATVSMSDRESFGIAAIESWRMGVPVVSRRIPVSEELIDDGVNGFLVDGETELASALRTLVTQRDTAANMGAAGQEAANSFSWRASAETLVQGLLDADSA